jgi:hypothetical protein
MKDGRIEEDGLDDGGIEDDELKMVGWNIL